MFKLVIIILLLLLFHYWEQYFFNGYCSHKMLRRSLHLTVPFIQL